MSNWTFIALLHNLALSTPVGNEYVAIVPDTDSRAIELLDASPALVGLVESFTDQFGRKVSPSLLLVCIEGPPSILKQETIMGFRNALAISAIAYAWQEALVTKVDLHALKFSNYFDLYPITVGRDNDVLVIRSPSVLGFDSPNKFVGQTSPELASSRRVKDFYDTELFTAIMTVWAERFVTAKKSDWRSRVLFRSLEMAYHASAIPFENNSTIYDYGAKIALWVSAFEVLVRSETEQANLTRVLSLLQRTQLYSPRLRHKLYSLNFGKSKKRGRLSQKIYHLMHSARNEFLHGNPVEIRDLFINRNLKYYPLTVAAPILYKQALQTFLRIPRLPDITKYGLKGYINIRNFEEALLYLANKCP